MNSTLDFLRDVIYLPSFMSLDDVKFNGEKLDFTFTPKEPEVTKISLNYFTPRGMHITLSQAGICLAERLVEARDIMGAQDFRGVTEEARLKIYSWNQEFRRPISLSPGRVGKMWVERFRSGNNPTIRIGYDLENGSSYGIIKGRLESCPVQQTNSDIMRN